MVLCICCAEPDDCSRSSNTFLLMADLQAQASTSGAPPAESSARQGITSDSSDSRSFRIGSKIAYHIELYGRLGDEID